jgi:hypothetical protein
MSGLVQNQCVWTIPGMRVKNGGESREDGVKVEAIFKGTARKELGFAEDHGVRSDRWCEAHLK